MEVLFRVGRRSFLVLWYSWIVNWNFLFWEVLGSLGLSSLI